MYRMIRSGNRKLLAQHEDMLGALADWYAHLDEVPVSAPAVEVPAPPSAPLSPQHVEAGGGVSDGEEKLSGEDIDALRAKVAELSEKLAAKEAEQPPADEYGPDETGIPRAFHGLMLPDESPEKFTERMFRRWNALRQYRVDGTKPTQSRALPDMTEEENAELTDLEERNRRFRWLD